MRTKQLFARIPVPAKVKLVYARLTLNKLTTIYFIVAIVHCVLQVIFQLAAHAINVNARHLVSHILEQAKLTMDKFTLVENTRRSQARQPELTLTLCKGIPGQFGLTGKDVCDVLWSQSRGLVNDTVDDFLSPSSEDDPNKSSDSDSDSEKETTTPQPLRQSSTSTLASSTSVFALLPVAGIIPTSSAVVPTSTSRLPTSSSSSRTTATSTSSIAIASLTTSSFSSTSIRQSTSIKQSTSIGQSTSSSVSTTIALVAPTGVANLIKPQSSSSDSNSDHSESSEDESGSVLGHSKRGAPRRRRNVGIKEKREGQRKVFDRERLRPLSLPPRPRSSTSSPPSDTTVDIDESHPNLDAHRRHAEVAPLTSSALRRIRARDEANLEFVPIAPKRTVNPKRFISSRSKSVTHRRRALSEQDQLDVVVTPVFAVLPDSDNEKKNKTGSPAKKVSGKERLTGVRVSGLIGSQTKQQASLVAEGPELAFGEVMLSPGCALSMAWPQQVLRDFAREDLAMIGFQVWLLGMSVVAILNESIPHLIAGLFTQALSTGWSAFQMARSSGFRENYQAAIVRGTCSGVDVLPDYFTHRTKDEIPIVVLNAIFLIVTLVLSWQVSRVYGWQTFKRIGASRVMNRAYRLVLAFSIHLQVAVYFFVTSSVLWVNELLYGSIACFAEHRKIYEGVFITTILLLLPWLILGWIGVRRENKHMMHAFLGISLFFITAWAAMFASDVYRWTFATWPFFAAMTVVSYAVLIATTGLAVVCRYNFKKGLALFLQSQEILPCGDFSNALPDPEKVEFPTHRSGELPTFSVAFGQGGQPVPPSQMFPAPPVPAVPAKHRAATTETLSSGYSVNPFANADLDFWGDSATNESRTQTSGTTKSDTDISVHGTFRGAEGADLDVPRYSLEDSHPAPAPVAHRELPQWQEVRRSQLPFDLAYPQPPRQPSFQPQLQVQPQADRTSVYTNSTATGTGKYEVLRDGQWVQVDARELHRISAVSGVTHASGFSNASWAHGDDSLPLTTTRPAMSSMPHASQASAQVAPPPATRGFVGLPGTNVKPQVKGTGPVPQMLHKDETGVLGGRAVPGGW